MVGSKDVVVWLLTEGWLVDGISGDGKAGHCERILPMGVVVSFAESEVLG